MSESADACPVIDSGDWCLPDKKFGHDQVVVVELNRPCLANVSTPMISSKRIVAGAAGDEGDVTDRRRRRGEQQGKYIVVIHDCGWVVVLHGAV